MIISFSRAFTFVAIPRTGTHTVRAALRPHLAPTDWEQCTRFEHRLAPAPHVAAIGHGHLTASQIRDALVPGLWDRMTTFAFVRDPLARFQSAYFLLNREREETPVEALASMKRLLADPIERGRVLYRPQAEFVHDEKGGMLVDHVGRCETIERDLGNVCARLGLPMPVPDRVNAAEYPSGYEPDSELAEMIAEHYAADYALIARPESRSA